MSEESNSTPAEGAPASGSAASLLTGGAPPAAAPPAAQPSSGEFSFSSLLGEDGGFVEGWHDQLATARPEYGDYRKTLANYKTPLDALKALGETKALVGRKLNEVETVLNPNPEDPTAMGIYRQLLGIPDEGSPEAYEFRAEGELENVVDKETLTDFAKKAQELGITKKQFGALVQYQAGIMGQFGELAAEKQMLAEEQSKANFMRDMEKSLGGPDETDRALDLTVRMLRAGGMNDEEIATDVAPAIHKLGPKFVQALAKLAENTKEDKLPSSGTPGSQRLDSKDAYKSIIHDSTNPKHAIYHNPLHPDHKRVRAEVLQLIKGSR